MRIPAWRLKRKARQAQGLELAEQQVMVSCTMVTNLPRTPGQINAEVEREQEGSRMLDPGQYQVPTWRRNSQELFESRGRNIAISHSKQENPPNIVQ